MVNVKNEETKIKYICPICLKDFGNKKSNYQNHINKKSGCGVDIIKQLEEIKIENKKKDINILQLKEENVKLKEENEKLKNQTIIYNDNSNSNNITNNNFILQINNFDDTKCEVFIKNLLKYIVKSIYVKTVEDIYLNNVENHNIYVADKNRGIIKIWNDGIWQSKNTIIIDEIINSVVEYFNLSIEEIKEDQNRYEKLKNTISNKINYIQLCDLEYLDDLEDDPLENKDRIQRCKEFRKMVYDEIIILLHDNKNMVKETHKKIKLNIIKD